MKFLNTLFFAGFFTFAAMAQTAEITFVFSNITEAKGQIMIALNDASGKLVSGHKVPVTKTGEIKFVLKDVKKGSYTVASFHDVNKDEKLNTNMIGLPTEKYGFSNNARGTFGPPSLSAQKFEVSGNTEMRITLK